MTRTPPPIGREMHSSHHRPLPQKGPLLLLHTGRRGVKVRKDINITKNTTLCIHAKWAILFYWYYLSNPRVRPTYTHTHIHSKHGRRKGKKKKKKSQHLVLTRYTRLHCGAAAIASAVLSLARRGPLTNAAPRPWVFALGHWSEGRVELAHVYFTYVRAPRSIS